MNSPTDEFIRLSTPRLEYLRRKLARKAQKLSVQSDSPVTLVLKMPKGTQLQCVFDMLALCWILPYTSTDTREAQIRAAYANLALNFPDGDYSDLLFRVATLKQWNLDQIVREIIAEIGTNAFFGILLQNLEDKRWNQIDYRREPLHEWTDGKYVRRGQRKRGYTDKGSRPTPMQESHRIIREEEAKEAKSRPRPDFIDFIKPRKWKSFRR